MGLNKQDTHDSWYIRIYTYTHTYTTYGYVYGFLFVCVDAHDDVSKIT